MPRLFYIFAAVLMPLRPELAAVDFSKQIRPILSENCFFCHGPDESKREAGLRLDEEASAKSNNDGVFAVVPGNPDKSALLQRILTTDQDEVMPPPKQHKIISPDQVALLKQWIQEGAKWGKHWSYEKVVRSPVPKIQPGTINPVDAFLMDRLKKEKLSYAKQAAPYALIRRVALDLTGLPPTLKELQDFLPSAPETSLSQEAYEKVVDYFLAKPAFGEH
ncbi:MAG: DUF1549 domain-containing protein, partial [Prosthecobacter sp.]|nr:DUF1549 domain-containing protein [Prosthecobacter sp.]